MVSNQYNGDGVGAEAIEMFTLSTIPSLFFVGQRKKKKKNGTRLELHGIDDNQKRPLVLTCACLLTEQIGQDDFSPFKSKGTDVRDDRKRRRRRKTTLISRHFPVYGRFQSEMKEKPTTIRHVLYPFHYRVHCCWIITRTYDS